MPCSRGNAGSWCAGDRITTRLTSAGVAQAQLGEEHWNGVAPTKRREMRENAPPMEKASSKRLLEMRVRGVDELPGHR